MTWRIRLTLCLVVPLSACSTVRSIQVSGTEPHAVFLTDAYWQDVEKRTPNFRILAVDKVEPEKLVSLFTYTDRYLLQPGVHNIEYECNNRPGKRRLAKVPMEADKAYFLIATAEMRVVERRPTGRICPGRVVAAPADDPRCTPTFENIYEHHCDISVGVYPRAQVQQLKTWLQDWEAIGVKLLPKE